MENKEESKEVIEVNEKKINKVSFPSLEGRLLLVKVGDKEKPATGKEIGEITKKVESMIDENNINCLAFVTHHAVSIEVI